MDSPTSVLGNPKNGFFNQVPAFLSIADKMMTCLLERANFLEEEHGIRPRILKVTTISALMAEIVKGCKSGTIVGSGQQPSGHGRYGKNLLTKCFPSTSFCL